MRGGERHAASKPNRYSGRMRIQPSGPRGFTLIELMVTIAMVAILAALAAPSVSNFVSRSAMRGISTDFNLALQRTRLEAVNRNMCASICMSTTAGAPTPKCTTAGDDWGRGWIVFLNPSCDGDLDDTDPLPGNIVLSRDSSGTRYTLTNLEDNEELRSVTFSPRGSTSLPTSGFSLIDSAAGASDEKFNRTICLDSLGRVRTLETEASCS